MSVNHEILVRKRTCPRCGSEETRRSQMRGIIERGLLRTIGMRAYRCESCDYRYHEFKGIEASGKHSHT